MTANPTVGFTHTHTQCTLTGLLGCTVVHGPTNSHFVFGPSHVVSIYFRPISAVRLTSGRAGTAVIRHRLVPVLPPAAIQCCILEQQSRSLAETAHGAALRWRRRRRRSSGSERRENLIASSTTYSRQKKETENKRGRGGAGVWHEEERGLMG